MEQSHLNFSHSGQSRCTNQDFCFPKEKKGFWGGKFVRSWLAGFKFPRENVHFERGQNFTAGIFRLSFCKKRLFLNKRYTEWRYAYSQWSYAEHLGAVEHVLPIKDTQLWLTFFQSHSPGARWGFEPWITRLWIWCSTTLVLLLSALCFNCR